MKKRPVPGALPECPKSPMTTFPRGCLSPTRFGSDGDGDGDDATTPTAKGMRKVWAVVPVCDDAVVPLCRCCAVALCGGAVLWCRHACLYWRLGGVPHVSACRTFNTARGCGGVGSFSSMVKLKRRGGAAPRRALL